MGFWDDVEAKIARASERWTMIAKNLAIFALAGTVIGYWTAHSQETSRRHDSAWGNLRAAISWTQPESTRWGNFGQITAIETLTQDCNGWWRKAIAAPVFNFIFPDCVSLKSVSFERMELGSLRAAGADFSYSNLACTNLTTADLRNAKLEGASFRGAELAWANLRGAKLERRMDLKLANVSHIRTNRHTVVDLKALKCACIEFVDSQGKKVRDVDNSPDANVEITQVLEGLRACPPNKCDESVYKEWICPVE